jgi:hypothetical protein
MRGFRGRGGMLYGDGPSFGGALQRQGSQTPTLFFEARSNAGCSCRWEGWWSKTHILGRQTLASLRESNIGSTWSGKAILGVIGTGFVSTTTTRSWIGQGCDRGGKDASLLVGSAGGPLVWQQRHCILCSKSFGLDLTFFRQKAVLGRAERGRGSYPCRWIRGMVAAAKLTWEVDYLSNPKNLNN